MMRTKLYYKGRVLAVAITLMLAVAMTGCGKDTGVSEQSEEITVEADRKEQDKPKEEKPEKEEEEIPNEEEMDKQTEAAEQTGSETENQPQAGTAELTGSVQSMGADSFVVSQSTTEHHEDYDIEVGVAPGASGEVLVTVYVTDAAVYQYRTVKNGGVNPEDITSREGSYGDLQEGLSVILKGRWEKDSFYADSLMMMKFI